LSGGVHPRPLRFEEHAQNGRGIKRAARSVSEFLSCLAACIRALCAFEGRRERHAKGAGFDQRFFDVSPLSSPQNKNRLRKLRRRDFLATRYRGRLVYFFFLAGAFFEAFFAAFLVAFFIERFSLT